MLVLSIDFWNTLYKHVGTPQSRAQRRNEQVAAACHSHSHETAERLRESFSTTIDSFIIDHWRSQRCPSRAEVIEYACSIYGITGATVGALISAMEDLFATDLKPEMAGGAKEFLAVAHQRHVLYLTSDTFFLRGQTLRRIMQMDGILQFFKGELFSDEVGVKKPNPKAFRAIIEAEGCSARDVLHIGDDYETDCVGARRAGGRAVLFGKRPSEKHGDDPSGGLIRAESFSELLRLLEEGALS